MLLPAPISLSCSWYFQSLSAAAAAVESLGQTAEHVATLAAAQPPDSSARALGDRVAARLRVHRDAVLADVARLVD